jgi:hypothetical protein
MVNMQPLNYITFNTDDFELQGDKENVRVWYSKFGDGVGLYYFAIPPDIQADLESIDDVRARYRNVAHESGLGMIQVDTITVDDFKAVKTIFKMPQEPTGMTYIGSITVPFRDFSYVLKVQCEERGITGVRDTAIAMKESIGFFEKWSQDPYDASIKSPFMRNRAEVEEYDVMFPDHPLSRARALLNHIQATLQIADEIKTEPRFTYVGPASPGKA